MTMTATVAPTVTDVRSEPRSRVAVDGASPDDRDHASRGAAPHRLQMRPLHSRALSTSAFPERFPGIAIVGVADLGYGLNIAFSDGHNRGIYPKSYLLDLPDS